MTKLFLDLYLEKYGRKIIFELAKDTVLSLPVTDGSKRTDGEKWDYDTSFLMGDKIGMDWAKVSKSEWYLVYNYMYSLHCVTAKRHGIDIEIFYAELARDWFEGAEEGKTFYHFIHL